MQAAAPHAQGCGVAAGEAAAFPAALLLTMQDEALRDLIEARYGGRTGLGGERSDARQLLKKIQRLRRKAT